MRRHHIWKQFKNVFTMEYCLFTFHESQRRKFERLYQRNMTVFEYERKLQELSKFYTHLISDDVSKKIRFIDGLN